jgi:hypothetical protein
LADEVPHSVLQLISMRIEWEIEHLATSREIFAELPLHLLETRPGVSPERLALGHVPMVREVQADQMTVFGDDRELT